jgi:hypothetical protein
VKIYGHIGFWLATVAVMLAVASFGAWADDVKAGGATNKAGAPSTTARRNPKELRTTRTRTALNQRR